MSVLASELALSAISCTGSDSYMQPPDYGLPVNYNDGNAHSLKVESSFGLPPGSHSAHLDLLERRECADYFRRARQSSLQAL